MTDEGFDRVSAILDKVPCFACKGGITRHMRGSKDPGNTSLSRSFQKLIPKRRKVMLLLNYVCYIFL
ncbi:hypothetical protein LJC59_03845, partial [Desulfovibrio sp. OttesenSCG-928-A18]|nr:hypothetical protein [Desulfovibrio sp. OttesenSCG-928-A18]